VWGAVRAVQVAHPDRIVLVDIDDAPASAAALPALPLAGHSRLAVRGGRVFVPALVRATPPDRLPARMTGDGAGSSGTVLVTGADRELAASVTEHLVAVHGVRRLVLACCVDLDAEGADRVRRLADRLAGAETGVEVEVATYTAEDHASLSAVLQAIDAEQPLVGVIHAAEAGHGDVRRPGAPNRLPERWRPGPGPRGRSTN